MVLVVFRSLNYKGPSAVAKIITDRFFAIGMNQKTPSPSLVAFYVTPGKLWATSIFFVALPAKPIKVVNFFIVSSGTTCSNKDYCSPVLCLESEAKNAFPLFNRILRLARE